MLGIKERKIANLKTEIAIDNLLISVITKSMDNCINEKNDVKAKLKVEKDNNIKLLEENTKLKEKIKALENNLELLNNTYMSDCKEEKVSVTNEEKPKKKTRKKEVIS